MIADFSGYATRHGLKCADGRTIMSGAFKHQDTQVVPLVWQHQHDDPANILGHAILESREDGVYSYAFFNSSAKALEAKELVLHGDIVSLSIYANNLTETNKNVAHGNIREVSLVLAGANPGALIDNVNLSHSDWDAPIEEAVIYSGLTLEHSEPFEIKETTDSEKEETDEDPDLQEVFDSLDDQQREVVHHMLDEALTHGGIPSDQSEETMQAVQEAFASFSPVQRDVIHHMLGEAIAHGNTQGDIVSNTLTHAEKGKTVKDIFDAMSEEEKNVVYFMIGEAIEQEGNGDKSVKQSDNSESLAHASKEGSEMTHNVFSQNAGAAGTKPTLTHDDLNKIAKDAIKHGSYKEAFLAHAEATYGFHDIEFLFPDAKTMSNNPELISRQAEWVPKVLNATKHSPFAKIKSIVADLTAEEARAKGYVKGSLKKEEVVRLLKRSTSPTTVYKKQKLDRDDILDITDLDVVAFLKWEIRFMLNEEIARAILIGDGRSSLSEDKVKDPEGAIDGIGIRSILKDHEMYSHKVELAANVSADDIIDGVTRARTNYRGSGNPSFYTTDKLVTDLLLLKDKMGRRLYETEAALASALRVKEIIPVEVMEEVPTCLGIMVNLVDYTVGSNKGGELTFFEDFDIDFNQNKYLLETRISGALTKPKSAIVISRQEGILAVATAPSFDGATDVITIPSVPGVNYLIDGVVVAAGPQPAITTTTDVVAEPQEGYYFEAGSTTVWTFTV